MAKHAVSFQQLLVLRKENNKQLKALELIKDEIGLSNMPYETLVMYCNVLNRHTELDSIKRDRFTESEKRQQVIGYGETF